MTNEEIATAYQQAEPSVRPALLSALWTQNTGLLAKIACGYWQKNTAACTRGGQTLDDLKQLAFFGLRAAAAAYDPEKGFKLSAYFGFACRKVFDGAIGRRTKYCDPLNLCLSFDQPIGEADDGELTLGGTVADPVQAAELERAETVIYTQQLRNALKKSLDTLPASERDALAAWATGRSYTECAAALHIDGAEARNRVQRGLTRLRAPQSLRFIRAFRDDVISRHAWHGNSFGAWKHHGGSGVELATEIADRKVNDLICPAAKCAIREALPAEAEQDFGENGVRTPATNEKQVSEIEACFCVSAKIGGT